MEKEGTSAGMPPDYTRREHERHAMDPPQRSTTDTDSDLHSISHEDRPPQAFEGKDEECRPSYASDTSRDAAVVVPRPNRRGLFGQFTLLAEVENPKTYSRKKKWFVTFIVAWAGATAPMGSAILFRKSIPSLTWS